MKKKSFFFLMTLLLVSASLFIGCNMESVPLISGDLVIEIVPVDGADYYEVSTEPLIRSVTVKDAGEKVVFKGVEARTYTVTVRAWRGRRFIQ